MLEGSKVKMNSIKLSNGKKFHSYESKTILDSALQQGIVLEHSCRSGRCGVCKTKVIQGKSRLLQPEESLTLEEKAEGNILTCCRVAESDIDLDSEDLGALANYPPKISPCRIDSIKKMTPTVIEITLRLPPGQQVSYLPGQYVDVIGQGGRRRSYSIANAPQSDGRITLFIKKVDGGEMSNYWFNDAKVNDLLRLEGPLGTFFFREPTTEKIVMLATGTGIAPIKALLEQLNKAPSLIAGRRIFLIWGNRSKEDFFWSDSFENIDLVYTPVISQADDSWEGERGYVQTSLIESDIELKKVTVYACGFENMINSAKAELAHAGLAPHNFYSDAFVCSS
ncbi:FAD-binding oxidoreductase [Vreelandella neptunia]|uniref:FAD-binding oxidoreductase n=1 Tax=Vreelandella neptunia TaxID=115551 RepID=UPI00315B2B0F